MKRKYPIRPVMPNKHSRLFLSNILLICLLVPFVLVSCGPPPPPKSAVKSTPTAGQPQADDSAATVQVKDTAYFIRQMMNLKRLARHHPGHRLVTQSSHHPDNGPVDAGVYKDQYTEDGVNWLVLSDEKGPGVLTRMFFNNDLEGRVRIYFDHQAEPTVEVTFKELYEMQHEFFKVFTTFDPPRNGNGWVTYFPMPFEEHCTIMTDANPENLRYEFDLLKLPSDAALETFNGKLNNRIRTALKEYDTFIEQNAVGRFQNTIINAFSKFEVQPGESKLVANESGPAAYSFFAIALNDMDDETLSAMRLKMYWDDMDEPAVNIPLKDFFINNIRTAQNWNSIPMGYFPQTDSFPTGFFYCQFYMPFQKRGQIMIENTSQKSVGVRFARKVDFTPIPEDSLYFYARQDLRKFAMGLLYSLFEFEGKGNFVGFHLTANSDVPLEPVNFILTGDPYYYVDGEQSPSIQGAGLDNHFNSSDLFEYYSPYWLPTHGCLFRTTEQPGLFHAYRFHFLDAIPFSSSLFYVQEIGCPIQFSSANQPNTVPVNARWTCYWYGELADEPVERNEMVHYYTIEGQPSAENPVMQNLQLHIQLPPGDWTLRYAPVGNLNSVQEHQYRVEE